MNKKFIMVIIALITIFFMCNAVSAVDATVKNGDMEIKYVDSEDDCEDISEIDKDQIHINYYTIDKYGDTIEDEDNSINVKLNNEDINKLKQGLTVEKSLKGNVYKKVKKTKTKTIYLNKKSVKALKKSLKKNKNKFTIYDESKYAYQAFKFYKNKITKNYYYSVKQMVKIKIKGTTYKYALYQKCYGDSRDYKMVKYYKVKVYYSHYVFKPVKKVLKAKISYKNDCYNVKILKGSKLCNPNILRGNYVFK